MHPSVILGLILMLFLPSINCTTISTNLLPIYTSSNSEEPEFTNDIENITVAYGRNIRLACSVKNLGNYKVAWMHFEESAILTVHNHVVTRNPRISVSHDKHDQHRTWYLHIVNVQESDRGKYMCQINTVTAKTIYGYVTVVVPPNINDQETSSDIFVNEGENATLKCNATGSPQPVLRWRRVDNKQFLVNNSVSVVELEGNKLTFLNISRHEMGNYICIARNGIPPSISKQMTVSVDFQPSISVKRDTIGVPIGYNVTIKCFIEANPKPLIYWIKGHQSNQLNNGSERIISVNMDTTDVYKRTLQLTLTNVRGSDYDEYTCVAKNVKGEASKTLKLYASSPPTTSTTSTTTSTTIIQVLHDKKEDSTTRYFLNIKYGTNLTDKGSRYQSNLNEIDKSEQKSSTSIDTSKGSNWTASKNEKHGDKHSTSIAANQRKTSTIILLIFLIIFKIFNL